MLYQIASYYSTLILYIYLFTNYVGRNPTWQEELGRQEMEKKIYIEEQLCPELNAVAYEARKLCKDGKILEFWHSGGKLYIKKEKNSNKVQVMMMEDLEKFIK